MQSKFRFYKRGNHLKKKTNNRKRTSGRVIQCIHIQKGWNIVTKFIRHFNFKY